MPNLLDEMLAQTAEIETPKSFIFWAGLAAISAVVKKNVWLDKFAYKLYPNIYVMLIAKSGMRKGLAPYMAQKLVQRVGNTRVIKGRNSIQGLIKDLSTTASNANGNLPLTTACGFLSSGEFSDFLIEDPAAIKILTDLYDTHYNEEWKNTLRNSPQEVLKEPVITILGASNEALFKEAMPKSAYKGGFIARTIIIEETKRRVKNSLTRKPKISIDFDKLVPDLKAIATINGEFKWSPDGMELYENWYKTFEPEERNDPTGTADRIHDNILKVAMLLALSKRLDLVLKAEDLEDSFTHCQPMLKNASQISSGTTISTAPQHRGMIQRELFMAEGYKIERAATMRKFYGEMYVEDFDKVIQSLLESKMIDQSRNKAGETIYTLTSKIIMEFEKNLIKARAGIIDPPA